MVIYMNKQKKLILQRNIFIIILFVFFGTIIINNKKEVILKPKALNKINEYIDEHYSDIKNDLILEDPTFKNNRFTMKIKSKINNNLYFYISYGNRKINDTYPNDYLKGNTLLNKIKDDLKKEIKNKTNIDSNLTINTTLDECPNNLKTRILEEDNLSSLKIYDVEIEILIDKWNKDEIINKIDNIIKEFTTNNISPKKYNLILENKNDITEILIINNITENFIKDKNKELIINDIINKSNSKIVNDSNITFEWK